MLVTMAVDDSHPGCFTLGARLYAVPEETGHSVEATRASYLEAAATRRRRGRRIHWSVVAGGVAGGLLIDASAIHSSGLSDPVALGMMFVLGGLVGFASSIGIREAIVGRPVDAAVVRLPAVEIPADVAREAPEDSTADELALWSIIVKRYRAARVALDEAPFVGPDQAPSPVGAMTITTATEVGALAELSYITARHDYAPVAELLGLPAPR